MAEIDPGFLVPLLQIIWIDLVLSGDNAVVIALACRSLPPAQRTRGVMFGTAAAILLRVLFTVFVVSILGVPWLKLVGAVLLLWIAVKLTLPEPEHGPDIAAGSTVWAAVRTIAIADAVMSLDNVLAVAAASQGHMGLLIFGLLLSIPCIVFGSTLVLRLIDRLPWLVLAGAALLGWVAGGMANGDPALVSRLGEATAHGLRLWFHLGGAAFVLGVGLLLRRRAGGGPPRVA